MHRLTEIFSKMVLTSLLSIVSEHMMFSSPEMEGMFPELPSPEIETLQPQCFNKEITLRNKPVGYPEFQRVWEYGVFGDAWQAVGEFSSFLNNVDYNLREVYPCSVQCETCDPEKISAAISGTDYQFMKPYYMMYADLSTNKSDLANHLVQGIEDQHLGYLSDAERAYLSSFFAPAACQATGWTPPYFPTVSEWSSLGTVSSDEITISASSITPERAGIVTLAFRVRLESGPYSRVQLTDIKPKPPSFNAVSVKSCPNNSTGEISLNSISGVLPSGNYMCVVKAAGNESGYKYYFSGTEYAINEKFSSGSYIINLYYDDPVSGGCTINGAVEVGLHPELEFNASTTRASCPEIADGSITASIITYAGSYNFRLNNINFTDKGGTFTSLDNGNYTLEVTDICFTYPNPKTRIVTISEPSVVSIASVIVSDPDCLSSPDGAISVNVSGGENPYSYQLVDGSYGVLRSFSNIGTECSFNSLQGGTYMVMARSGNCSWKTSEIISLRTVNPVSFTTAVTDVVCFGENTGKINVTASGGNSSFLYSINNQPYAGTSSFESLASATYYIKVQSTATSCNDIAGRNVFVGTASKIEIGFTALKNPTCFEMDDGSITANVTGGTGSYLYSWEQNSGGTWYPEPGSSNVLSGLYAGSYRLSIRDSKNCTASNQTLIHDPPELIVQSATPSDVACYGGTGSILVTASGGTGSYTYSHLENSGFQPSSQINIPAGDYYVYVKDANGCKAVSDDLVTITEPDSPLGLSFDSPLFNGFNISCYGEATGVITAEATGGNGYANDGSEYDGYMYSLSASPYQAANSFSGLNAGSYTLSVKDDRGCVVQKPVILTEPVPLSLNLVSSSPVRCFGASTGEIVVSASGGIGNNYKYSIDGVESLSPGIFRDLYADTYEIEVTDLNGCSQNLFAVVQSLNPPIDIIATGKDVRCFGECNGEINTAVSGGAGGFSYEWEKKSGDGWLALDGNTGSSTNLGPGIYRVKVTDTENCYQYQNSEINEPSLLQVTGVSVSDIACFGDKGTIGIEAYGGTSGFTYYCSAEGSTFQSSLASLHLPPGSYSASVEDANGCTAVHASKAEITAPASPLDFTATLSSFHGYSVSCNGRSDGQISVEATGGKQRRLYGIYLFAYE